MARWICNFLLFQSVFTRFRGALIRVAATIVFVLGLATLLSAAGEGQAKKPESTAPDVVVHVADLPMSALSEFDFWNDSASPGGKLVGYPNRGDILDPPPEDDPHVTFSVPVQRNVPYRCWVHMKVGPPKGKSQANMVFVQFTDALDKANKEAYKPGTGSYLTARGSTSEGWKWVGCDAGSSPALVSFKNGGTVTVRIQAGMEGVGFDQVVLSPARFLDKPPAEAVVAKAK
ncbi:MAG TPA: hypothetical protein VH701_12810 [Vicinamibacterales bacterium]|jgi:hypothetical protein